MKLHTQHIFGKLRTSWTNFWFRPLSAAPFSLMRIAFGFVTLLTLLQEVTDIGRYYGPLGILEQWRVDEVLRANWRFSLLDYTGPFTVYGLYIVLLLALFSTALGYKTRTSLCISTVLLYSFHEYGQVGLDGGSTLLRLIAFILLLSPCHQRFTLDNFLKRKQGSTKSIEDYQMPIWPYRLLLWQMIILYAAAATSKWSGQFWKTGSAVSLALHNPSFSRLPMWVADSFNLLSPFASWATLLAQFLWILLLPLGMLSVIRIISPKNFDCVKRWIIAFDSLIHLGILLLMDVGTFSLVVFVAYIGLFTDNDIVWIRSLIKKKEEPIIVLYDGRCGLCKGSIIFLHSLDWFHTLRFVNYHDPDVRKKYAQGITLKKLDSEIHVRYSPTKISSGFLALRSLVVHLPILWWILPFAYLPGMSWVGQKVYVFIAKSRA